MNNLKNKSLNFQSSLTLFELYIRIYIEASQVPLTFFIYQLKNIGNKMVTVFIFISV